MSMIRIGHAERCPQVALGIAAVALALAAVGCRTDEAAVVGDCDNGYTGANCERCAAGYVRVGEACLEGACADDSDCGDGDACNGEEVCSASRRCERGTPVACGARAACAPSVGTCVCIEGYEGPQCDACAAGFGFENGACVAGVCDDDSDCDDVNPCNGEESCGADRRCAPGIAIECGGHGACAVATGACACEEGYRGEGCEACDDGWVQHGAQCLPGVCAEDAECADNLACNGEEACSNELTCAPGEAIACGANALCVEPEGACVCDPGFRRDAGACVPESCEVPQAPTLSVLHGSAVLRWTTRGGQDLEVGTSANPAATSPDSWGAQDWLVAPAGNPAVAMKAFARVKDSGCSDADVFSFLYQVWERYPGAAGEPLSDALAMDDPRIAGWASSWVEPVEYGDDVDDTWRTPQKAVGAATGEVLDVVTLGRGGRIVMVFEPPIVNIDGDDFAVFENAFGPTFLELAFVEVSSDGVHFVRFDSAYLGDAEVGSFSGHDSSVIGSLAGKFVRGFGTPFDLQTFVNRPEVRTGLVDLNAIRYVRLVDVVGDGDTLDSFGRPILDPYPTAGSAGFDLEAIAVLRAW